MKKCEEREACIFLFGIFWQVSEGARRVKRWLPLDWYVSCLVRLTGRSTKRPLVSIIEAHHAPYWSHPIWGAAGLFFFYFILFFWGPAAGRRNCQSRYLGALPLEADFVKLAPLSSFSFVRCDLDIGVVGGGSFRSTSVLLSSVVLFDRNSMEINQL